MKREQDPGPFLPGMKGEDDEVFAAGQPPFGLRQTPRGEDQAVSGKEIQQIKSEVIAKRAEQKKQKRGIGSSQNS